MNIPENENKGTEHDEAHEAALIKWHETHVPSKIPEEIVSEEKPPVKTTGAADAGKSRTYTAAELHEGPD